MLTPFAMYWVVVLFLFGLGIYALIFRHHLVHLIIGVELMAKGLCLGLLVGGAQYNDQTLNGIFSISEAMVITIILIEVATTAIALSLVVAAYKKTGQVDIAALRQLKG